MRFTYVSLIILTCFACSQSASTENDTSVETDQESDYAAEEESVPGSGTETNEQQGAPVVYVTHDGDKYHTADCRYSKTARPAKLSQAKAEGKTACQVCKPNSRTGEKQVQCSGKTADGKRCQRLTTDQSGRCFQHRED